MDKHVKVTVNKFGAPKIEAVNFEDNQCLAATKSLEELLSGGAQPDVTLSPEAYLQAQEGASANYAEEQSNGW